MTSRAQEFPQLPENGDKVQLIILGGKGKGSHNQSSFSLFKKINTLINWTKVILINISTEKSEDGKSRN